MEPAQLTTTRAEGGFLYMLTENNMEIALSLIETPNARDPGLWANHLCEDYTAEHPACRS